MKCQLVTSFNCCKFIRNHGFVTLNWRFCCPFADKIIHNELSWLSALVQILISPETHTVIISPILILECSFLMSMDPGTELPGPSFASLALLVISVERSILEIVSLEWFVPLDLVVLMHCWNRLNDFDDCWMRVLTYLNASFSAWSKPTLLEFNKIWQCNIIW